MKSVNALRDSRAPTCRVMVALSDSFSGSTNQIRDTFRDFQRDVSHESVGNNDVDLAVVKIAAFNIARRSSAEVASAVEKPRA